MTDPLMAQAMTALSRGHRLFAGGVTGGPVGDTPARLHSRADGLARAHRAANRPIERLHRLADTDTALARILAAAQGDRAHASEATRTVLEAARADLAPAIDTPLGRREAVARMAARLRAQHRHITGARSRARLLALRLRRLRYPHSRIPEHRSGRAAVRGAIRKALAIKGIHDPIARARWERGMDLVARRESSYNARAVNAATGAPSVGAWQFIAPTFAAYHELGTSSDIHNLVAQACAFINYARGRYGVAVDAWNLADRIQQADPRRPPKGY